MDTAQETMCLFLFLLFHGPFPKLLPAPLSGNTLFSRTRTRVFSSLAPCPLPGDPFRVLVPRVEKEKIGRRYESYMT